MVEDHFLNLQELDCLILDFSWSIGNLDDPTFYLIGLKALVLAV